MKVVIDIEERYYELIKYNVEKGMNYMPCVIIAKGEPLPNDDNEYQRFAEFVVGVCTTFALTSEEKAHDIIEEIIEHKSKYPNLSLLWDQYCGNFS